MRTAAILLAGGSGTRLRRGENGENGENKAYVAVGGRPLVSWSLDLFEGSPLIDDIVLVVRAADTAQVTALKPALTKLRVVVEGGLTRHASEHAGLDAIAGAIEDGEIGLVCIHDAARPFVSADLLARVIQTAGRAGGAVPGLPLETPVFRSLGPQRLEPVVLDNLRRMQTPQAFRARQLLAAYRAAAADGFAGVDTAESVQRYSGLEIRVVAGDPRNIKITFVADLFTAGELAATWHSTRGGEMEERIVVADPVADPQGYQRELLALLGGQDAVTVLEGTPLAFRYQTAGLREEPLARRPAPREWSVAELLGHLWDAEIAYGFRARAILAQDSPRLSGYDQDAWATLPRPAFAELLDAFTALRIANLALVRQTPEPAWDRVGVHEERGAMSFRLLTGTLAGHDRAHLQQLEQTIAAVRD